MFKRTEYEVMYKEDKLLKTIFEKRDFDGKADEKYRSERE